MYIVFLLSVFWFCFCSLAVFQKNVKATHWRYRQTHGSNASDWEDGFGPADRWGVKEHIELWMNYKGNRSVSGGRGDEEEGCDLFIVVALILCGRWVGRSRGVRMQCCAWSTERLGVESPVLLVRLFENITWILDFILWNLKETWCWFKS